MKNIQTNTNEQDYFVIPNPIYDVVFRYLMQDYDSAMIILSTLINEKIKSLEFKPLTAAIKTSEEEYQEQVKQKAEKYFKKEKQKIIANKNLTELEKKAAISQINLKDPVSGKDIKLMHLDFTAVIEKENGEEEMVMIELQKVAIETDIFRFKQYIAENFQKKRKIKKVDTDTGKEIEMELPYRLIPIFILNFEIEDEISDLMIKTRQVKTGIFTDKEMSGKNEFIDNLSYELYVVQLPYLSKAEKLKFAPDSYKGKLFALLQLFDQRAKEVYNEYRLRLFRKVFPGFLDQVIKRLQAAAIENPNLEKQMQAEDYYLKPLLKRDNKISWLLLNKKQMETELQEKDKELSKKNKELSKKDQELSEKDKELSEKDKKLSNTSKALQEKENMILNLAKTLKESGKSIKEIQNLTGLSKDVIDKL